MDLSHSKPSPFPGHARSLSLSPPPAFGKPGIDLSGKTSEIENKAKKKNKKNPKVKQLGLISGVFFFQWLSLFNSYQVLAICRIGRVGIKDTKRTNLPVEETDGEIGDYNPVK